jgi:hypothetical protein
MAHGYRLRDEDVSPDGRFGVIHADADTIAPAKARNYLVALGPFRILGESKGAVYHQPNDGHGAIVVEWAKDNTAALVMVGHKWGTIGATLFELKEGRVTRRTDLYAKVIQGPHGCNFLAFAAAIPAWPLYSASLPPPAKGPWL